MKPDRAPVWVTPLPPIGSGIAQYSRDILQCVARKWDLELLAEPDSGRLTTDGLRTVSLRRARSNSRPVIQIGNSGFHPRAFQLASRPGAVLVLHDVVLHHARLAEFVKRRRPGGYVRLMKDLYGQNGADVANDVLRGVQVDLTRYALSEDLISNAACVVVHSEYARDQVQQLVPQSNVRVIRMGIPLPALVDKQRARRHLDIPDDAFVVSSITHVNPMKRLPVVLRAFRKHVERHPHSVFVIAGSVSPTVDLRRYIDMLGLSDHTRLTGYLSDNEASILAQASDVAVNLRYPSTGETSASLLRLLGARLPVVVTAHGSSLEIPEEAAIHLPVDRFEEETLAEYLYWLATDSQACRTYGNNARAFIERNHSMANAVKGYRDVLKSVWNLDLSEVAISVLSETAPELGSGHQRAGIVSEETPRESVHSDVADGLHYLGLTSHDGTIQKAASALAYLDIRSSKGDAFMAHDNGQCIDPELLKILACPVCKVSVRLEGSELVCDQCGRHYRIENGIPIMLVDEPT